MTRTLRVSAMVALALLVGMGWDFTYAQDRSPQDQLADATVRWLVASGAEEADARAQVEQGWARASESRAARQRARDLGVEPSTSRDVLLVGVTGTYVFADEFQLDAETNSVLAVGNVVVRAYDKGSVFSSLATDRLTIGEGF